MSENCGDNRFEIIDKAKKRPYFFDKHRVKS